MYMLCGIISCTTKPTAKLDCIMFCRKFVLSGGNVSRFQILDIEILSMNEVFPYRMKIKCRNMSNVWIE